MNKIILFLFLVFKFYVSSHYYEKKFDPTIFKSPLLDQEIKPNIFLPGFKFLDKNTLGDSSEEKTPEKFYPDLKNIRPAFIQQPNDVLLIVLEPDCDDENLNMENKTVTSVTNEGQSHSYVKPPPSKCVWAILSCCAPNLYHFRYACFNYLECTVSFWQPNPCQLPIILRAAEEALNYYKQFESRPSVTPTTEKSLPQNTTPFTEVNTSTSTTATTTTTTTTTATDNIQSEQT